MCTTYDLLLYQFYNNIFPMVQKKRYIKSLLKFLFFALILVQLLDFMNI